MDFVEFLAVGNRLFLIRYLSMQLPHCCVFPHGILWVRRHGFAGVYMVFVGNRYGIRRERMRPLSPCGYSQKGLRL